MIMSLNSQCTSNFLGDKKSARELENLRGNFPESLSNQIRLAGQLLVPNQLLPLVWWGYQAQLAELPK
jgi:hypothetical protein